MGFYELGNGCDSCDTISPILPTNVNVNPYGSYGTQGANQNQYNTGMVSSGYAQGGAMGSMGNGSSGSTMGAPMTTQTMVVQTVPVTTTTTQMKQVQVPGPAQVLVPAGSKGNKMVMEGFVDSSSSGSGSGSSVMSNDKMWIVLGLVIFSALAGNECCKYFLNKSLQLNDGSPLYYVAYAGVAVLLTFAAFTYVSKN
jgi:hypothetical protein